MTAAQVNAYAARIRTMTGLPAEELQKVVFVLSGVRIPHAELILRLIHKWGYHWRRFERACDYAARPWPITDDDSDGKLASGVDLGTFTQEAVIELLYRCGEIHEDGEWRPVEMALRRPVEAGSGRA
jgi:hypothetical protein